MAPYARAQQKDIPYCPQCGITFEKEFLAQKQRTVTSILALFAESPALHRLDLPDDFELTALARVDDILTLVYEFMTH